MHITVNSDGGWMRGNDNDNRRQGYSQSGVPSTLGKPISLLRSISISTMYDLIISIVAGNRRYSRPGKYRKMNAIFVACI